MKAAILTSAQTIEVRNVPAPEPGPADVVIAVKAAGVCGTDVHMFMGGESSTDVVMPLIMGHEFSGIAEWVGADVEGVKVGDKVAVNPNIMCGRCHFCRAGKSAFCIHHAAVGVSRPGGFAEKAVAPGMAVHRFERADFDEGAMLEPLSCCLNVFEAMPYKLGDAYLIVGGGPIGMMMLQLARLAGARFVAVSEPVAEKREKCLFLGADAAYTPSETDAGEVLSRAGVSQWDSVIDCVGLPATQSYSAGQAGRGTRVMFFGIGGASDILELNPYRLFVNQSPIYSSFINPYTFERTVGIVEARRMNLRPIVSSRIRLDGLRDVLAEPALRSGGKVMVVP